MGIPVRFVFPLWSAFQESPVEGFFGVLFLSKMRFLVSLKILKVLIFYSFFQPIPVDDEWRVSFCLFFFF